MNIYTGINEKQKEFEIWLYGFKEGIGKSISDEQWEYLMSRIRRYVASNPYEDHPLQKTWADSTYHLDVIGVNTNVSI